MTVTGLLLIAMIIMKFWPETGTAHWLHHTMVERPLALLSGITRQHLILAAVTFTLLIAFSELGAPQLVSFVAVDVSMVVDAMFTAWTIAALTRVKGSWTALRAALPSLGRGQARTRRRRQRRAEASGRAANDDEHPGLIALAV